MKFRVPRLDADARWFMDNTPSLRWPQAPTRCAGVEARCGMPVDREALLAELMARTAEPADPAGQLAVALSTLARSFNILGRLSTAAPRSVRLQRGGWLEFYDRPACPAGPDDLVCDCATTALG